MQTPELSCALEMRAGRPRIFINGEEVQPVIYGLSDIEAWRSWKPETRKNIRLFAQQGIKIVLIDSELRHCWKPDGAPVIDSIRADIRGVIAAEPDAAVLIRLHVNAPYWWMKDHPEEMVEFADGPWEDDGKFDNIRLISNDLPRVMRVSLASEKWLAEGGAILRECLARLARTPEGGQVIGVQIAGGVQGEWHQWGAISHDPDYSAPMRRRFRRYLRETYQNDSALREAWGNRDCAIETAQIPGMEERYSTDDGHFRDPVIRRNVIDSLIVLQKTISEAILHFCMAAKQAWPRPLLCGAFNGYVFDLFGRAPISGHLEAEELFRSPYFDFFCAPFPYGGNRCLDGYGMTRGLLESARLHGKLCLMEMDQHPIGTPRYSDQAPPDAPVRPPEYIGGDPAHFPETIALLRRDMLENYTRGAGAYYYDHRLITDGSLTRKSGWWEHPALQEAIGKIQWLWNTYGKRPFVSGADVAVVYDNRSYYSMYPDFLQEMKIENQLLAALAHSGAAFDQVHSFDLDAMDWDRYRCVIFANAVTLTTEQRRLIRENLQNRACSVMWIYAPGYSDGRSTGKMLCEEACGFMLNKMEEDANTVFPMPPFGEIPGEAPHSASPIFSPSDGTPIAFFTPSRLPAGARKQRDSGGLSFFLSLPPSDPRVVRNLLKEAGCHIYTESGDALQAGGGILVLTTSGGGPRSVTLRSGQEVSYSADPNSATVIDAENGTVIL